MGGMGGGMTFELPARVAFSILEGGRWVGWAGGGGGHSFHWELPKGDLHSADQDCSRVQIIALSFSACHRDILAICCELSLMSRKSGLRGHSGCFSSAPGADLTRGRRACGDKERTSSALGRWNDC